MLKDQLRMARKAAGKTQQEVADYLHVNYSTYSCYETGKRTPDALKIRKIAAFLGVTGDFLLETGFEAAIVEKKHEKNTILCEAADEIRLIRYYRSLNDSGKSAALSAVEGLSRNPALAEEGSNIAMA